MNRWKGATKVVLNRVSGLAPAAADFRAPRLETRFNTTFVAPFQRFMETPTQLGISVWHASGHKADSVASLPSAYRSELARYRPELSDWIGA